MPLKSRIFRKSGSFFIASKRFLATLSVILQKKFGFLQVSAVFYIIFSTVLTKR